MVSPQPMTFNQAAAFFIPVGRHRGQCLAIVALNDPDYLAKLADEGAPECPVGGQFHTAVSLVVARLRATAKIDDIDGYRTVSTEDVKNAVAELHSKTGTLAEGAKAKAEQVQSPSSAPSGRGKVGKAKASPTTAGMLDFGG
jgi:hypothetical protein